LSVIHPTAIVYPGARLAGDVEVGPYSVIGEHVEIGPGTRIGPHVVITGHTRIGRNNRVFQFASLGDVPQDKKYGGEPTRLEIGDNNTIRECCTFNVGTAYDAGITRLGNDNWVMAYTHVAHDSQIGNNTVLANSVQLAGHVLIGDFAILGGATLVHQFCHIGAHAFTAGGSVVLRDVPPYGWRVELGATLWPQQRRTEAPRLHAAGPGRSAARLQDAVSFRAILRRGAPAHRRAGQGVARSAAAGGVLGHHHPRHHPVAQE
jgi:UDP-N-acetylglucosamine acyltransferase